MTPLQWAVLTAYARMLPSESDTRQRIEAALAQATPTPAGQRVAVTLAEQSGMIEKGRITEFGRDAAKQYLARFLRGAA